MEQIYQDVPVASLYADEIRFVTWAGIMSGDTKGNFNPKQHVTTLELCVIIVNTFNLSPKTTEKSLPNTPDWALPFVIACQEAKLLPDDFAPSINQEAEIADMFRVFELAKKQIFQLSFKERFLIFEKFADKYLSRRLCAHLIHLFFQYVSREVNRQLLQPDGTNLSHLLSLVDRFAWIQELSSSDIYQICSLLKPSKHHTELSAQMDRFVFMRDICNLKQKFSYRDANCLYHYTSLFALEKLTLPDAQFHLSNTAYLNDPQEGLLGMNKLSRRGILDPATKKKWYAIPKSSSDVSVHPSFIASFMTVGDLLPMWVQYGGGGAGCCMEFDPATISEPLYSVTYSSREINAFFTNIFNLLKAYQSAFSVSRLSRDPVFQYASTVLEQGCYLYKAASYKHEQEVRIITFAPFSKAKAETSLRPGEVFPRVYCETPLQRKRASGIGLNFTSITLGPTVQNPEQIAVALAQRGYPPNILKKSKIKFR